MVWFDAIYWRKNATSWCRCCSRLTERNWKTKNTFFSYFETVAKQTDKRINKLYFFYSYSTNVKFHEMRRKIFDNYPIPWSKNYFMAVTFPRGKLRSWISPSFLQSLDAFWNSLQSFETVRFSGIFEICWSPLFLPRQHMGLHWRLMRCFWKIVSSHAEP